YNEEGYNYNSMMEKQNNNNDNQKRRFNNNAANERSFYNNNNNYNAENNMYNGEKQGTSDTIFLKGGKYFYDVNYEKYNPTMYNDLSRGMNNNN
ncbi:protein E6-like, partial [Trifolium medium]|nr:protein E6-like [Trifolium medium]